MKILILAHIGRLNQDGKSDQDTLYSSKLELLLDSDITATGFARSSINITDWLQE